MVTLAIIQIVMLGVGLYLFTRQLGLLHQQYSEINEIVREVNEKEVPSCKFYPQEMPTVKEIHKVVEETSQREFMNKQYERVRKEYNS